MSVRDSKGYAKTRLSNLVVHSILHLVCPVMKRCISICGEIAYKLDSITIQTQVEFLDHDVWKPTMLCKFNVSPTGNCIIHITYEPSREKTCLMSYANNKDADQPAHPRSLISVFVFATGMVLYL